MAGATPYITPSMLLSRPAGLSWRTVPTLTADDAAQLAQLAQVCWTATSAVNVYCRQPLRAVVNTEQESGPAVSGRVGVNRATRRATVITRRAPVLSVQAVQFSQAFADSWSLVPAGQYRPRHPVVMSAGPAPETGPSGGNAIDIAPGYITLDQGRGGFDVMTSYTSGWPHAGLTATAGEAATELEVDDVTGWAGWTGFIYDGIQTELVQVTSAAAATPVQLPGIAGTVQAGPGTLTLSGPTAYQHQQWAVISALPGNALHGAALYAAVEALETLTSIAAQSMATQLPGGLGALATEAELRLDDFRRVA